MMNMGDHILVVCASTIQEFRVMLTFHHPVLFSYQTAVIPQNPAPKTTSTTNFPVVKKPLKHKTTAQLEDKGNITSHLPTTSIL
jgi:hypothetical protein